MSSGCSTTGGVLVGASGATGCSGSGGGLIGATGATGCSGVGGGLEGTSGATGCSGVGGGLDRYFRCYRRYRMFRNRWGINRCFRCCRIDSYGDLPSVAS